MSVTEITTNLVHVGTSIPIDGRLSWRAPNAHGYEPIGGYLALDPEQALMIFTGVAAQRDEIVADVHSVLGSRRISLLVDRNEADVIGNLSALTKEFEVESIWYAGAGQIVRWFTFDDENRGVYDPDPPLRYMVPDSPALASMRRIFGDRPSAVTMASGRTVRLVYSTLTTLGFSWEWDEQTGTMFTGDFLSHGSSAARGVLVLREDNDTTTYEDVRDHLFQRFYWMREARVKSLLDDLDQIFTEQCVERIAPNHGCVIEGADLVAQHVQWVRTAIEQGAREYAASGTGVSP